MAILEDSLEEAQNVVRGHDGKRVCVRLKGGHDKALSGVLCAFEGMEKN